MALSDEQKKKIEEEEAYRAQVRDNTKKKKGSGCLKLIGLLFFVGIVISAISSAIAPRGQDKKTASSSQTPSSQADSKASEEQQKQQAQELSNLFCSERSQPNVRAVNLADFLAMYEANGETVTLRPANGVYPTNENCQKVIDICLKLWDAEDCKNIAERKIWIGMAKDQLILSWGLPNDKNNSTYSFGVHSQWVYGTFGSYVYLEGKTNTDMKVTSWQD